MRMLRRFLLPDAILVAAALVATHVDSLRTAAADMATGLLVAAVAAGILLSLRFHRGRIVLVLLLLALAEVVLSIQTQTATPTDRAAAALVAVLLPLNFAAISLLSERGVFTVAGLVRLGALVLELLLVAPFTRWKPEAIEVALDRHVLPAVLTSWTQIQQLALIAGVAALALFIVIWIREPSPIARGLFWALVAVLWALDAHGRDQDPTIWLAAASFVLALAVVEASYALAYHDGLTGLPARRAFNEALRRLGQRYAVAMVDVDHFKACNDQWGHDVGDQVLRMVAAKLGRVGAGGRPYRYGGEEFAVLFSDKSVEDVRPYLDDVREAVEAAVFVVRRRLRPRRKPTEGRHTKGRSRRIAVTISIGLAESDARKLPETVVQSADQALYRAKEGGRNRVEV